MVPPQDVPAEQSVLGSMLLSKDAIADAAESVDGRDFYRPAHESIYEAIIDLYGRGEPADAITVADELTKRGELSRVGGQAYLHELIQGVPTAANAGYYAEIVAERAVLRRLVTAGTRIVQMGYADGGGDVVDVINAAQAEVFGVTAGKEAEDYVRLGEIIAETADEIDAASSTGGQMTGVPTGFTDLDALTNGLHPGQMIVIAARPAVGKALALDTPLPTPTGWTTMGEVNVGDRLIAADGTPTTVVAATEVMTGRPCYEVEFSDGTVIVADEQHQWLTDTRSGGGSAVRTTREIADSAGLEHSVQLAGPVELPEADLPVRPYAFGAWLARGDAASAVIDVADDELMMLLEGQGGASPDELASLGVLGNRHVPMAYLRAGAAQRWDLLAGLLDAVGTVTASGRIQFTTTDLQLRDGVDDLLRTLGVRFGVAKSSTAFTFTFSTDRDVFWLDRKKLLHKQRRARTFQRRNSVFIADVRPVPSVPVRCVEVDHPEHLYLASSAMIPTHNSTIGLDIARACSIKAGMTSAVFSLEMSKTEISMRLLSAEGGIQLQHMRKGTMRDEDWTRLATTMGKVADAPLFIDDSPNMSLMEIRSKCRRLKERNDLKLVVIDYLQLMTSGKRVESRQQEVSEFSRALKLLAKELNVPVIAISQLNRGPEQRTDKRPQMSDLRESGCLTADTRLLRADSGAEQSIGELARRGEKDVPVWALDDSLRYVVRHLTHAFSTGVRPVFRMTLASGKTIRATENHRFLTYDGWRQLGDLRTGDRLAVPRHVPAPEMFEPLENDAQLKTMAYYWSSRTPFKPRNYEREADACAIGVDILPAERRELIPDLFHMSKREMAVFANALWRLDGPVTRGADGDAQIFLQAASRRLIDDVARLLLRFGISTQVLRAVGGYQLHVRGVDDVRRFLQEIYSKGSLNAEQAALRDEVRAATAARGEQTVDPALREHLQLAVASGDDAPALSAVATALDTADLDLEAINDILWDPVVSIDADGIEEVFDATVVGGHNFIADGIAAHNSIEQDADMVILLHREDSYDKESERAGEADLIVAKHRNGPTDTITVAFQGHYSRFTNMAQNF
ncbi:replicative DNA helicase [Flexivirga oryzae]|nr:replicative DNA helicase [Flexivirga oryzae]